MYEFPGSRWMLSCLLSPLLRSSLLSAPIPEPSSFKLKLKKKQKSNRHKLYLSVYNRTHEWSTKNSVYLFIKGKVPSLPRLWLGPGVARFAGSENIILSIVHVVETFGLNTKKKWLFTANILQMRVTAVVFPKGEHSHNFSVMLQIQQVHLCYLQCANMA